MVKNIKNREWMIITLFIFIGVPLYLSLAMAMFGNQVLYILGFTFIVYVSVWVMKNV